MPETHRLQGDGAAGWRHPIEGRRTRDRCQAACPTRALRPADSQHGQLTSQRQDSGQQPERSHDLARQPAPNRGGLIVASLEVQQGWQGGSILNCASSSVEA